MNVSSRSDLFGKHCDVIVAHVGCRFVGQKIQTVAYKVRIDGAEPGRVVYRCKKAARKVAVAENTESNKEGKCSSSDCVINMK